VIKLKRKFSQGLGQYSLDEILSAPPEKLDDIASLFDKNREQNLEHFKFIRDEYERFATKKKEYDAYDLATKLKLNVCPYCNRIYTFTLSRGAEKYVRPQFDHFYDKASYPILALSFFNLIPSCSICNSSVKGSKQFTVKTHLHPYLDSFHEKVRFSVRFKNMNGYFDEDSFDLVLKTESPRAQKTIEDLKLELLYCQHKDIALEQIQKAYIYPETRIQEIWNEYGGLFKGKDELMSSLNWGFIDDSAIERRPLSKLMKDISDLGRKNEVPFGIEIRKLNQH